MTKGDEDFHRTGWSRSGFAPLRALWGGVRGAATALIGKERLTRLLWSAGFFHAKSRFFRTEIETPDGLSVRARPEDLCVVKEIYEDRVYADAELPEDGVVVDCGAHIGLFTLFAAHRCRRGRVVACEPSPMNLELLRANVERNGLDRVTVLPWALSGETRPGEIHFSGEYSTDYVGRPVMGPESPFTLPVEFHTLDELFEKEKIGSCDLLKIDIEGSELAAMKAGGRALAASRQIVIEIHKMAVSVPEVVALVEAAGFSRKLFRDSAHAVHLYGRKK